MNTSCISRSRTSITRAPKPRAHRRMASVNAFNKTALNEFYRVAYRKGVVQQTSSRPIWTHGSKNTMWRSHQGRWCFGKTFDADLLGCNADDEGVNDRGLTATETKTKSLNQAPAVRLSSGNPVTRLALLLGGDEVDDLRFRLHLPNDLADLFLRQLRVGEADAVELASHVQWPLNHWL
jgi:hypothetical protein